jgi:hypothetical protein
MFVQQIRGDGVLPEWEKCQPTMAMIERAIRVLDGTDLTEMMLLCDSGGFFAVAGGGGYYQVSASSDGISIYSIRTADRTNETVELVAAGQRVKAPRSTFASLADTLSAAKTFAEHGTLDPSVTWVKN